MVEQEGESQAESLPSAPGEACFIDAAGQWRRWPWARVAQEVALEGLLPMRDFPVRAGRRVAPGWWWSASTGRLVHYGFGAMRTQVMLLDQDPRVAAVACSPVELRWVDGEGALVVHVPHLMVRLRSSEGMLVDCVGGAGLSRRLSSVATGVAAAVRAVGWRYRVARPPDPVLAANVRWLAGYRHPRNGSPEDLEAVAACFGRPRPLADGVRQLGDPLAMWPVVFHALWTGVLHAPLDRPLHERVLASTADADGTVA
ncbi:TnsA-like heteromeric transposase endonuclease subunit [Streptomyces sp. NPDC006510]|uniref:TnsA-like heteromeric transposase endonuclease subunit n=1 Tax=Streptomyces sp. NPDC006510 TaxID=3155600 RepID=UPI0033AE5DB0